MLIPLLAVLTATCSLSYSKYLLTKKKIPYLSFTVQSFWAILIVLLPGTFFSSPPVNLPFSSFFFFGILVLLGCAWNLLYFHGMKEETLVESQLMGMLVPLFSALLGFLLFADERHIKVLILVFIGAGAIIWSHISHHHLRIHHGSLLIMLSGILISSEAVLVKVLLSVFSAYWLYFFRIIAITFILTVLFPSGLKAASRYFFEFLILGVFMAAQFLLIYWSFLIHGLVVSNLFFLLIPICTGLIGHFLFHEHISRRQLWAWMVLLLCILLAQLI